MVNREARMAGHVGVFGCFFPTEIVSAADRECKRSFHGVLVWLPGFARKCGLTPSGAIEITVFPRVVGASPRGQPPFRSKAVAARGRLFRFSHKARGGARRRDRWVRVP